MSVEQLLLAIGLLGATGSGLIAGVFFAFSTFVMRALAKLPAHEGIAAMQSINVAVLNPFFLTPFLGTVAVGIAAAVAGIIRWREPGSAWLVAGGLLYVVGTFGVTVVCNVPMNEILAAHSPAAPESADYWRTYVSRWTTWNHVRTATALMAMISFIMAFRS